MEPSETTSSIFENSALTAVPAFVDVFEEVYEFNAAIEILAADAELIKLPLTTPISVNLVNTDELKVFKFAFETLAADADEINEPVIVDNAISKLLNPVVELNVI